MPDPTPTLDVNAHWDAEANVWWAESEAVPGLVAESETVEGLLVSLRELIPELMRLNGGVLGSQLPIRLIADRREDLVLA